MLMYVLLLQHWRDAYLFPPCTHHVLSDTRARSAKEGDGRAFWGIAFFIYCWCVSADRVMVEQPDTIISDFYLQPTQSLRACDVGDPDSKPINLFCREKFNRP